MEINLERATIRAREMLETSPKCWVEQALAREDTYCVAQWELVPNKLQGPNFPRNLQYDTYYNSDSESHPLFAEARLWAKELREHNSCISMMSDIASDCESMFRDRLNAVSPSRCFMCHVKGDKWHPRHICG
jgi:hypothetical protein